VRFILTGPVRGRGLFSEAARRVVATSRVGTFGLLCDVHARIKGVRTQVDCERVDEDGRCSRCLMSAVSHFIDVNPFLLDPLEVGG